MQNNLKKKWSVERAVITRFMSEKRYWELQRKYGHSVVWAAFSDAVSMFNRKGLRMKLFYFIRRWRLRFERVLHWLEAE